MGIISDINLQSREENKGGGYSIWYFYVSYLYFFIFLISS